MASIFSCINEEKWSKEWRRKECTGMCKGEYGGVLGKKEGWVINTE